MDTDMGQMDTNTDRWTQIKGQTDTDMDRWTQIKGQMDTNMDRWTQIWDRRTQIWTDKHRYGQGDTDKGTDGHR